MESGKKAAEKVSYKAGDEGHGNPLNVSPMKPLTSEAYGGGIYGKDNDDNCATAQQQNKRPASETQSADGPPEATMLPKHTPPPSTGDRDIDITGQSYIQ